MSKSEDNAPDEALVETSVNPSIEGDDDSGRRSRKKVVGLVVGGVLVVLAAVYAVGFLMAGDKLPRDAQVAGVAIGGQTPDEAVETLRTELQDEAEAPIAATVGEKEFEVAPAAYGLSIDYEESVAQAGGGRSFDPRHIWNVLTGGTDRPAVVEVDEEKLSAAVDHLAKESAVKPKDATLAFKGAEVKRTDSVAGVALDAEAAPETIEEAYLSSDAIDLAAEVAEPEITTEDVDKVVKDFASKAVSAPVKVRVEGEGSFEVSAAHIGNATTFEPKDGTLAPKIDAKKLHKSAAKGIKSLELKGPRNATVRLEGGKPTVVPARNGSEITDKNLLKAVQPALTKSGNERSVAVELTGAKADFTTDDAKKLGVKEVVGEFTTNFPYAEYRNVNLGVAAKKMNNTLVKPGDTFSLNGVLGERTEANGYIGGYVIQNGRLVKEVGGGVSQSATTVYNAMFFAGLKDIEHQPHTLYFPRYPAGREATVYYGSIDLRFQNDTKYGVLVTASTNSASPGEQGSITVKMWSTQVWDEIKSPDAKKSNYTTGQKIENDEDDCEYQAPIKGFDADYYRSFVKDGKEVKRENYHWRYAPGDEIVCK